MGLFGKKEAVTPQADTSQSSFSGNNGTIIAEGMTFEGEFFTEEQMDIRGNVKGKINSTVDTHIAKTGVHEGIMNVKSLHLDGKVNSEVVCADVAALGPCAEFRGSLSTKFFEAEHGSDFEGSLTLRSPMNVSPHNNSFNTKPE